MIGVHTPEFSFEHEIDQVWAVKERNIDYPVALDNGYAIWSAFDNHYWPALYFVDRDGVIRDHHFGEGRYEQSESVIQRLLDVEQPVAEVAIAAEPPETAIGLRGALAVVTTPAGADQVFVRGWLTGQTHTLRGIESGPR